MVLHWLHPVQPLLSWGCKTGLVWKDQEKERQHCPVLVLLTENFVTSPATEAQYPFSGAKTAFTGNPR
jgi:hypothetical protein